MLLDGREFTTSPWLRMTLETTSVADLEEVLRVDHDLRHYLHILMALLGGAIVALFMGWFMHYLIQSSDLVLENMERVQMLGRLLSTRHRNVRLAGRGRLVIPEGFRIFKRLFHLNSNGT